MVFERVLGLWSMQRASCLLLIIPSLATITVPSGGLSAVQRSSILGTNGQAAASFPGVIKSDFVFERPPFASAHASTIVETSEGPVVAWFGGTREGAPDVGIWLSRQLSGEWAPPGEVATGIGPSGTRVPCWNPVLYEMPDKALMLFYKVGTSPQGWWGMVRTSR